MLILYFNTNFSVIVQYAHESKICCWFSGELALQINDSKSKFVIADKKLLETVRESLRSTPSVQVAPWPTTHWNEYVFFSQGEYMNTLISGNKDRKDNSINLFEPAECVQYRTRRSAWMFGWHGETCWCWQWQESAWDRDWSQRRHCAFSIFFGNNRFT